MRERKCEFLQWYYVFSQEDTRADPVFWKITLIKRFDKCAKDQ